MAYYVQILGTDTEDSFPSILIFFDKHRYLFNCGEGIQRLCIESGTKLLRVKHIFFTQVSWRCIGGLPGFFLTMSDAGATSINISGPAGVLGATETFRYFLNRKHLNINICEFDKNSEAIEHESLKVYPIVVSTDDHDDHDDRLYSDVELHAKNEQHYQQYNTCMRDSSFVEPLAAGIYKMTLKFSCFNENFNGPHRRLVRPSKRYNTVCCYACHFPDIKGKFDVQKSILLKVPMNARSKLVQGQCVKLEDGSIVHPHQCISPSTPGKILLIIHCPNVELINVLVTNSRFEAYRLNGQFCNQVTCIIHITPASVIECEEYKCWMSQFSSSVQHLLVNREYCKKPAIYQSFAQNAAALHQINSQIFCKYHEQDCDREPPSMPHLKLTVAEPLLKYHINPHLGLDCSCVFKMMNLYRTRNDNGNVFDDYDRKLDNNCILESNDYDGELDNNFKIYFLGTGAAIPSKYRNVSCTYLEIGKNTSLLLDAGENSLGQIFRTFGECGLETALRNLKFVFVSHIHADHHTGLVAILCRRREMGITNRILILGPKAFRYFLEEYSCYDDMYYDYYECEMISCNSEMSLDARELVKKLECLLEVEATTIPVHHCPDAYAISMRHESGWKVVFSGDTRPCELLENIGNNCDILIHEATFDDSLISEAVAKSHSTTVEALEIAKRMNAKFLLMTHFSQRYPKIPLTSGTKFASVTFDMMVVSPSVLHMLPGVLEKVREMFEINDVSGDIEKTQICDVSPKRHKYITSNQEA